MSKRQGNKRQKKLSLKYRLLYPRLSLPSKWGQNSALFPMAKSDVISQFYIEKFPIEFTFWTQETVLQSNPKIDFSKRENIEF